MAQNPSFCINTHTMHKNHGSMFWLSVMSGLLLTVLFGMLGGVIIYQLRGGKGVSLFINCVSQKMGDPWANILWEPPPSSLLIFFNTTSHGGWHYLATWGAIIFLWKANTNSVPPSPWDHPKIYAPHGIIKKTMTTHVNPFYIYTQHASHTHASYKI